LVEAPREKKHLLRVYFEGKASFLTTTTDQPHETCEKVYLGALQCQAKISHQIPSQNIDRKIFLCIKNQNIH